MTLIKRPDRVGPDRTASRLRLAVVSDAVEPFHTGGKEARYAAILPRLAQHGIDVEVHTMKWWPDRRRAIRAGGLAMRELSPMVPLYNGTRRSIRQAIVFALCSLRLIVRRFDVLEADAIPFVQLFPLWIVVKVCRRPFVVTWHEVWGQAYWREYLGPAGVIAAWLERLAARLPDAIIATSEDTADRVRQLRGRRRDRDDVVVVTPGLDRGELADVEPARGIDDIVCVGRLLAHKNVHLVVESLARLRAQGRDLRLTVVGLGPERERLEAMVGQLHLANVVTFRDPLADRLDLLQLVAGAQVVAFPSVREGFGMVALEALACGVPVVTSDHVDNYARRLVIDGVTGRVCAPTAQALAESLADVLDHRDQMAEKAADSVAAYDWQTLAATVASVVRRQRPDLDGAAS